MPQVQKLTLGLEKSMILLTNKVIECMLLIEEKILVLATFRLLLQYKIIIYMSSIGLLLIEYLFLLVVHKLGFSSLVQI